jgi:uncharacterized OB-fold protein
MVMAEKIKSLYGSQLGQAYAVTRSPEADPFWEGCRQGRIMLPWCSSCHRPHFYPRTFCPNCCSADIEWREASGRGTIYTFAVVRQPIERAFADLVPYVIAIVELDEGVRMLSHIVSITPDEVRCDMRVAVDFKPYSEKITLPMFRPVG